MNKNTTEHPLLKNIYQKRVTEISDELLNKCVYYYPKKSYIANYLLDISELELKKRSKK